MKNENMWSHFSDIDVWIFDLDNTLYPSHCDLFSQMDVRMGEFVSSYLQIEYDEAKAIQKKYFAEYGTTLKGLMTNHGLDPKEYLHFVHDIDVSHIKPDEKLNTALGKLEGRKIIFTNASEAHAQNVSTQLGIDHHFEAVFDIYQCDFIPKPDLSVYKKMLKELDIDPKRSIFFEDMAKNLVPAHELGMRTVWIPNTAQWSHEQSSGNHINHVVEDLSDWLFELTSQALED